MAEKSKYASETVGLPSRGWFYEKDSSLSSGTIELKLMTAKEENILSSVNLVEKGVAVDRLLQALIVDPEIKFNDLLLGDKNGIMIAARILGYGKDYPVTSICPICSTAAITTIDLQKIEENKVEFKEEDRYKNEFQFKLPVSNRTLTFKFLTHGDEMAIDKEVVALESLEDSPEISPDFTTRLFYSILSVDGDSKVATRKNFVENEFLARDSLAFRNHVQSIRPDIDLTVDVECSKCKSGRRLRVPITSDFFWPGEGV